MIATLVGLGLLGLLAAAVAWWARQAARRRTALAALGAASPPAPRRVHDLDAWGGLLALAIAAAVALLADSLLLGVLVALLALGGLVAARREWSRRRGRAFEAQLPEAVATVARALRVGQPLDAALAQAEASAPEPMSGALCRVREDVALGRRLEEALRDLEGSLPGVAGLGFLVSALVLQRESGGNLAGLLERLAEQLRQRAGFRRELQAITAEGRSTALVLGALPLAFGLLMAFVRPDYLRLLLDHPTGQLLLVIACALEVVGFVCMRALARVEA